MTLELSSFLGNYRSPEATCAYVTFIAVALSAVLRCTGARTNVEVVGMALFGLNSRWHAVP